MRHERVTAFVAAYDEQDAMVLWAGGPAKDTLIAHIGDTSPHIGDLRFPKPPGDGLWLFEGEVAITDGRDGQWGIEVDSYAGTYRRPTDVEALAAAIGENPLLVPCGT